MARLAINLGSDLNQMCSAHIAANSARQDFKEIKIKGRYSIPHNRQ